jgi:hypothetical protein
MSRTKTATRPRRSDILIVCDDTEIAPYYFNCLGNAARLRLDIKAIGQDPLSVVKEAKKIADKKKREDNRPYDFVWCVFDKDDFDCFDEAITSAKNNEFHIAYSNQCFELWFLLHFSELSVSCNREKYADIINKNSTQKYIKKNKIQRNRFISSLVSGLIGYEEQAALRAENQIRTYPIDLPRSICDPSTTVPLLVRLLREKQREYCI